MDGTEYIRLNEVINSVGWGVCDQKRKRYWGTMSRGEEYTGMVGIMCTENHH